MVPKPVYDETMTLLWMLGLVLVRMSILEANVILRLSRSTIEDLSFYCGFAMEVRLVFGVGEGRETSLYSFLTTF